MERSTETWRVVFQIYNLFFGGPRVGLKANPCPPFMTILTMQGCSISTRGLVSLWYYYHMACKYATYTKSPCILRTFQWFTVVLPENVTDQPWINLSRACTGIKHDLCQDYTYHLSLRQAPTSVHLEWSHVLYGVTGVCENTARAFIPTTLITLYHLRYPI